MAGGAATCPLKRCDEHKPRLTTTTRKQFHKKTLEKVWGTFLRQASKHGFDTLLLGQPDASTAWRDSDV